MVSAKLHTLLSLGLSAFCLVSFMGLPQVSGKNVAHLTGHRDEHGRLQLIIDKDELLHKRDSNRQPLDLDHIINPEQSLGKRDPESLPLDPEGILANEENLVKRGQKAFAGDVKIMDLDSKLPTLNQISIFYEYMRNDIIVSRKLSNEKVDLIIIAPTNDAISRLGLKPWQFPRDIETMESNGALETDLQSAIEFNIQEFVRSHTVDYDETKSMGCEKFHCTILKSIAMEQSQGEGGDILLKKEDDRFYIASIRNEKFFPVEKIETAGNGVVLLVDTCLVWP